MHILHYEDHYKDRWDDFVRQSKNGTFLFMRDYMEYHKARFIDHSLLILDNSKSNILALLPANKHENELISHQGLTYGGLITDSSMTQSLMVTIFESLLSYLLENEISQFLYKTIPAIYHHCPADEDHYALFLLNAVLKRRDILTVIDNTHPVNFQTRRKRQLKKAETRRLIVKRTDDFNSYWNILEQNLKERHNVSPVHTRAEINFLVEQFPDNIKLFGCYEQQQLLAGVVVYETELVAHFQYIASSHEGKSIGALDWLFANLIQIIYATKRYIDFGISNEQGGRHLNTGLIDYKEGFGGRSIKHDYYHIEVK